MILHPRVSRACGFDPTNIGLLLDSTRNLRVEKEPKPFYQKIKAGYFALGNVGSTQWYSDGHGSKRVKSHKCSICPIDGRMIMRNHKQTFAVAIRVPSRNPTWNPTNQQFCKRNISTTNAHFSWLPHEFSVALLVFDTYPQHNADPAMGPFAQTTLGGESNKTWIFHPEIRGLSRENGEVKQFHAIFRQFMWR